MEQRIAELKRQEAEYKRNNLEGGEGYNPYTEELERLSSSTELRQYIQDTFESEWTAEVTAQRRAEWNARVQGGEFGRRKIDGRKVREAEKTQGWTVNDLKKAVELHS